MSAEHEAEEREALEEADREFAAEHAEHIDGTATEIAVAPEEAQPFVPDPEQMVPLGGEVDVFRRMELEDERAIMEELQGRALDVMLYDFESGGKRQLGFSWQGIAEGVGTLNRRGFTRIRISPAVTPRFEEVELAGGERAVRCTVYAEDAAHGSGNYGVAEQPLKMRRRNGNPIPDPFAHRKALSKAQRNALEPLVPLELREYLKAQYQGAGKVRVIPGAGQATPERPPALTDERAVKLVERMREVYGEIKDIHPNARLVMPPGQFNAILMGAQHDHGRLEDALEHLEAFRDGEEEVRSLLDRYRAAVGEEPAEALEGRLVGMEQAKRKVAIKTELEKLEEVE